MRITEAVLGWVQEWRDELVPSSERKRFDPANKTQWSMTAFTNSVKSYSTMSQTQLTAAAKSGAHWLEKRVNEFSGEVNTDKGVFASLEECHYKLKKRGAKFPEVDFSSSGSRGSFDIQRCSSIEETPTFKSEQQWGAFASDAHSAVAKASESPSSVFDSVEDEQEEEVSPSALTIKIKAVMKPASDSTQPVKQQSFFLAPPPGSPAKVAAPATPPAAAFAAAAPALAPAPVESFDFLDFGAAPASAGNPFEDDFSAGNPFDDVPAAAAVAPVAAVIDESDPFAALAMRAQF